MKMLLSISWRNIWRNPARSSVLMGAIVIGMWAGIMISSLTNGMMHQRFNNLIEESVTHAQVHHPEYLIERDPSMMIPEPEELFDAISGDSRVDTFTARTLSSGMIQSPLTTSGVQIHGVRVDMEPATTTFHENIIDGEYLDADIRNPILLGESLSEKLDIGIGNRVVLTFQSVDDELTSASFNVVGIFKTASDAFDERNVRVRSEDLSELLAGSPVYHEIAVMLQDADSSKAFTDDLGALFPNVAAETWYELSPELRYISDFGNSMTFYIMLVILLALAFGILNTMLMAIFERTRELGMLMAVGMSRIRIFVMIMLESVVLTLSGAVIGILIAVGFVNRLDDSGIDMAAIGGESLSEFGYDTVIYPIMTGTDYTNIIILVICTAIISAIYPAIKALRIKPAEVVREK